MADTQSKTQVEKCADCNGTGKKKDGCRCWNCQGSGLEPTQFYRWSK